MIINFAQDIAYLLNHFRLFSGPSELDYLDRLISVGAAPVIAKAMIIELVKNDFDYDDVQCSFTWSAIKRGKPSYYGYTPVQIALLTKAVRPLNAAPIVSLWIFLFFLHIAVFMINRGKKV